MDREIIKILIVEDNDFDFELVERKIKGMGVPYVLKRAVCAQDLNDFLLEFYPDLILSDYSIPSYSGLEALKFARVNYPDIPFIFVSGTIGEERAVEALKQGAIDYVLKDNLNKLEPAVKRALREASEKVKRKEAEEKVKLKNKELRTLIYRISHDIRGPLCSIKSAASLGMESNKKQEFFTYLGLIEEVTKKLDNTLINLSNFQYVYADEINFTQVNLEELITELLDQLSLVEGFNQVKFNIKVEGDQVLYGERNFLLAILYNLIHNSVVFSDENKPEKIVNCTLHSFDKSFTIVVEDNGIGIPESIQGKVCDMFYRGNNASKGAGLGLYLVKTGVELLNGRIEINSKVGLGTQVSITIRQPVEGPALN